MHSIEMGAAAELFLNGLALGLGPCMVFCLPILVPFIAGTRRGWLEGLKATLAFSLSRLAAYTLLGLLAGLSGELLIGLLVGGPGPATLERRVARLARRARHHTPA